VLNKVTRQTLVVRRLTQPLSLEDGRPPRILRSMLITISAFVMACVIWAAITQVQELTIAPGQIIPRGQIQAVQHLEGGIVAEIYVREGENVTAQQPLLRLRPEAAISERNQYNARRVGLELQLIRLEAQSRNEAPNFGDFARQFAHLVEEQEKLNISAVMEEHQERAGLSAKVAQKRGEIATITSDLQIAKSQLAVQLELMSIQDTLQKSGSGSRKNWLESKALMQRAEGDVLNLEGKLGTARDALLEAESNLGEAESKIRQKLSEERVKAASDLAETEQQLIKLEDRLDRLVIRSPSEGVVQELAPKSPGEVIRPGDLVARIVPTDRELVAEVHIDPKDSGHVRVGADADIRLATYDSAIFGQVRGKVEYISATTFSPPPGQPTSPGQNSAESYYKATIHLLQDHVGTGNLTHPITPGMVLQANIKTGSKSIIRYMFKPVFNSLDVAFSER
jgi:membrane fusion protein, adhesin transport system